MQGNKKTFIEGEYFYKQYSKNEFYFLKMLHGVDAMHIDTITCDGIQYIEIPKGSKNKINKKEELIKEWREKNPTGTKADCNRDTKIDPKTIRKWW